jgi:hypothetical protein
LEPRGKEWVKCIGSENFKLVQFSVEFLHASRDNGGKSKLKVHGERNTLTLTHEKVGKISPDIPASTHLSPNSEVRMALRKSRYEVTVWHQNPVFTMILTVISNSVTYPHRIDKIWL